MPVSEFDSPWKDAAALARVRTIESRKGMRRRRAAKTELVKRLFRSGMVADEIRK
jgi:hypothetical protein